MNPMLANIPASQVLVAVSTACSASALGTTETRLAAATENPNFIGFAAFDARLVDVDPNSPVADPVFLRREGDQAGQPISIPEINERWGSRLREDMGSRFLPSTMMAAHVPTDIGAPLAHRLERGSEPGGLRERAGLTFKNLRESPLVDMGLLFDDDPRLGPSLQSQLFLYSGLGALAALPRPLSELIPDAYRFRIAASTCFPGAESWEALRHGMQKGSPVVDKAAYRLASSLNTHGPALLNTMLAPSYPISSTTRAMKKVPDYLEKNLIRDPAHSRMRNVPQAPLVSSAACASALLNFCDIAPQIQLSASRRYGAPVMALWTSADAALSPDARILEGFGPDAMMNRDNLVSSGRSVSQALAPFDISATGTIVGNAGYGILITTLEFALANFLDIVAIFTGWGQSGEAGGKGHMAGVGFGGENALIAALMMSHHDHGFGVESYVHDDDHATGTKRNSATGLNTLTRARRSAAEEQGYRGKLPRMSVSAPKAIEPGEGHPMSPAGHQSVASGIQYGLGRPTTGISTLREVDPELGEERENYDLKRGPIDGNEDGRSIAAVQGFGGYNAALTMSSANRDTVGRYPVSDERVRDAYFERWPETRRGREEREARANRVIGSALMLAVEHRWPGAK
jgi:3-oxoacyl-[acyl-carrier-protein] synthase II